MQTYFNLVHTCVIRVYSLQVSKAQLHNNKSNTQESVLFQPIYIFSRCQLWFWKLAAVRDPHAICLLSPLYDMFGHPRDLYRVARSLLLPKRVKMIAKKYLIKWFRIFIRCSHENAAQNVSLWKKNSLDTDSLKMWVRLYYNLYVPGVP